MRYLVLLFLFFFLPIPAFAEEVSVSTTIDYKLPYPGILPGHPLFALKEARETFMNWFIASPMDKTAYDLEQAEKYVQASYLLFTQDKEKTDRVTVSLFKAESYLGNTLKHARDTKQQGGDAHEYLERCLRLLNKQQEFLETMESETLGEEQSFFTARHDQIQLLQKEGEEIRQLQ